MKKISSILIPFDFSKSAINSLEYAIKFTGNRNLSIELLHIHEKGNTDELESQFKKIRDKYSKKLKQPISWNIQTGNINNAIKETRTKKENTIIIMGTSGLDDNETNTRSSQFVSVANCPVIVVPEDTEKSSIKNICLVLGRKEIENPKALHILLEVARVFNAKVHVLTVQNTNESLGYSYSDEKNENTLMYYLEDFYSEHTFVENSNILEGITNYTTSHNIDLIAIIPRHHTTKSEPSRGLLTRELVYKSEIPILTIE